MPGPAEVQAQSGVRRRDGSGGAADEQRRPTGASAHPGCSGPASGARGDPPTWRAVCHQPADRAQIAGAEDQLSHTEEDLNRPGHRAASARTGEQGLQNALAEIAHDVPIPVDLESLARLPPLRCCGGLLPSPGALTNLPNTAASHVTVRVRSDDNQLNVEVADDGISGADLGHGSGLKGLADRVETLGGKLHLEAAQEAEPASPPRFLSTMRRVERPSADLDPGPVPALKPIARIHRLKGVGVGCLPPSMVNVNVVSGQVRER